MGKINEVFHEYMTTRRAKKFGRSYECQYYRDELVKKLNDLKKEGKSKKELAEILGKEQGTVKYAEMMINCGRTLNGKLAEKLINSGNVKFIIKNIENFKNHNEIAKFLIDSGNWIKVRDYSYKFNISDEKIRKELENKHKEREEEINKLKEIGEKFLEFGIKYTVDEENLLLNIEGDIKGKVFDDCYKLGLFQYVGEIDGNLEVSYLDHNRKFTFENLKCVNGNLMIWRNVYCEAKNLCLVNKNLDIYGSLEAPLKKIGGNCYVEGYLPSNYLEYIGGNIYFFRDTAPMGATYGWIYFPVLKYVGGVTLNGYRMGSNKSIEVGNNTIYGDVIYFIDPDDPMLKEKINVICNWLSREDNKSLYDLIPTNKNYKNHKNYIESKPIPRDPDRYSGFNFELWPPHMP